MTNVYDRLIEHGYGRNEVKFIAKHGGKKAAQAHIIRTEVLDRAIDEKVATTGFPSPQEIILAAEGEGNFRDNLKTWQRIQQAAAKNAGISRKAAFEHYDRGFVSFGEPVQRPANASKWKK